jgi:diguanylate cyclase (GGDEF)-like protein
MADIDFFKNFNDACGHREGDDCLRRVARALESVIRRDTDLVARYGGEEFAIVLPATDSHEAFDVSERMRLAVNALAIPYPVETGSAALTVSIGVATCWFEDNCTAADLVERADRALYRAKSLGRNRTVSLPLEPRRNVEEPDVSRVQS